MNKLFIIVPVFNRKDLTLEYVRQLQAQSFQDFTLILVDEGNDGTGDDVKSILKDKVNVLSGDGSLWWAGSLQLAINYLKNLNLDFDPIIHINNDDTLFDNLFLKIGVNIISGNTNSILVAQAKSNQNESIDKGVSINWSNFNFNPWIPGKVLNCLSTRGLFMRLSDIIKIGEFKPTWLPHYLSDYEFTIRGFNRGLNLICPDELRLTCIEETTGVRRIEELRFIAMIKSLFSLRNTLNPWIFTKFIVLASPWRYKLKNLVKIYYKTLRYVVRSLITSLKN